MTIPIGNHIYFLIWLPIGQVRKCSYLRTKCTIRNAIFDIFVYGCHPIKSYTQSLFINLCHIVDFYTHSKIK